MERVVTAGPELASAPATMRASTLAERSVVQVEPRARPAWQASWRPVREDLLLLGYHLAVALVLAAVRYPAWRIAVLLLAGALPRLHHHLLSRAPGTRRYVSKHCVNTGPEQVAFWAVVGQLSLLVATVTATAVTGGLGSPLLLTVVAPYAAAASLVGDRRETRGLLGFTAAAVAALALLPPAWTGPGLAPGAHRLLVVVSVVGAGALLSPAFAILRVKRAELARAREELASDALARAQSLEQIGAKVAHELKNPLTGVKALVQLGLRNPAEAASHERLVIVEREVGRMQEVLQNYLTFTRPLQGVRPARVELGALVSDALLVLSARADEARIRLYTQGDATLDADPRLLREALLNLVANAIEATPPGGEVVVDVRPAGDEVELVVRDTGRGMAPETLRRLGTPFFTTRDDGTGLGVVLARSVIAQHGGALSYDSQPGAGTRVTVSLPRAVTGRCDGARTARG